MKIPAHDWRLFRPWLLALFLMGGPAVGTHAQVQSLSAAFNYAGGGSTKLNVERISGYGGTVQLSVHVYGPFVIGVSGGYASYAIEQTDQLTQWNWDFWNERYYPKIQADLRADPSLSVNISSVQKMSAIPVRLHLEYHHALSDDWVLVPRISGGVVFYTRQLYADETWTKTFPAAGYSLTYSFRNFAPDKKGNIPLLSAGCDIQYRLSGDVRLYAGLSYTHFTPLGSSGGFGDFPLQSEFTSVVGLTFEY